MQPQLFKGNHGKRPCLFVSPVKTCCSISSIPFFDFLVALRYTPISDQTHRLCTSYSLKTARNSLRYNCRSDRAFDAFNGRVVSVVQSAVVQTSGVCDLAQCVHSLKPQLCHLDHVRSYEAGSRHRQSAGLYAPLSFLETLLRKLSLEKKQPSIIMFNQKIRCLNENN